MNVTRVLLADDHVLVRAGIRTLLERIPNVEVVAEASNGREALELVKSKLPNLVLMDVAMAELGGLEALLRITKNFPGVKVIILSAHASEEYVIRALRNGAAGYMLKDAATVELELAITSVGADKTYLSPSISRTVINSYLERVGGILSPLEGRRRGNARFCNWSRKENAQRRSLTTFDVSVKTVESHRLQLMERLNIHDVPVLVRYAVRSGLVSAEK